MYSDIQGQAETESAHEIQQNSFAIEAGTAKCLDEGMLMKFSLLAGLSGLTVLLSACAPAPEGPTTNSVTLMETANTWQVSFEFAEPQEFIVFRQAPVPYRAGDWRSVTPGVEVQQIGSLDVIVFDQPASEARFDIVPQTRNLPKAYTPFLQFSDGSGWGVLEGQFRVSSASSLDELQAFEGNADSWPAPILDYDLKVQTDLPIYRDGKAIEDTLTLRPEGDGKYIYVGAGEIEAGENYFGVVDQGLPNWITASLDEDLALIFGALSEEWQLSLPSPAEILFVFDGAENPGLSQTGGALGNQLALQVSGEALLEPDDSILDYFRWFLAHESAHLFQSAAGMDDLPSEHAWMHEGGANTMAHRIGGRIAHDREAFLTEVYGRALTDCSAYLETGAPLVDALQTGQFYIYYACGDLMGLITEAALAEGDIFSFWRGFLDAAKAEADGAISAELYLRHAADSGVSDEVVSWLRTMIYEPVPAPRETILAALEQAGLDPVLSENGDLWLAGLPN